MITTDFLDVKPSEESCRVGLQPSHVSQADYGVLVIGRAGGKVFCSGGPLGGLPL